MHCLIPRFVRFNGLIQHNVMLGGPLPTLEKEFYTHFNAQTKQIY